jgi:hypothetical protein
MAEWITRLEPRYPEVWSYHAWNLAYNIGAIFPDPADRWHWVATGRRLLRDEGIPANPGEAQLYWELGWLYADKVSGRWDESPLYFRAAFAAEMTGVLGVESAGRAIPGCTPMWRARLSGQGLVPDLLKVDDDRYGPLDWRLPEAHALYWGQRGRRLTRPYAVWCDRLVWHAMADMVSGGRLYFDPMRQVYLRGPRPDLATKGIRLCTEEHVFSAPLSAAAAEVFLREALLVLHAYGLTNEACEALATLQTKAGVGGGMSVETLVREVVAVRHEGLPVAASRGMVEGLLSASCMWKAVGEAEPARGLEAVARLNWEALAAAPRPGTDWHGADSWAALYDRARAQAAAQMAKAD